MTKSLRISLIIIFVLVIGSVSWVRAVDPPVRKAGAQLSCSDLSNGASGCSAATPTLASLNIGSGCASTNVGQMPCLQQQVASNSATVDFTTCINATYDDYEIHILNVTPGTTNQALWMRMSTDGGSTYDSGNNYNYLGDYNGVGDTPTTTSSSSAAQALIASSVTTTTSFSVNGTIRLHAPGSAIFKFSLSDVLTGSAGNFYFWRIHQIYKSTSAVNAFRFLFASGNVASGTIRCYGIAH